MAPATAGGPAIRVELVELVVKLDELVVTGTVGEAQQRSLGNAIGRVTSGGFGPTVEMPIAMGYVPAEMSAPGTQLVARVRNRAIAVEVVKLPFRAHNYYRG